MPAQPVECRALWTARSVIISARCLVRPVLPSGVEHACDADGVRRRCGQLVRRALPDRQDLRVVSSAALTRVDWRSIADAQAGMVAAGRSLRWASARCRQGRHVDTGRWRRVLPGVYATFTGPISAHGRVWAALLYAGRDAAASHGTALWLWGLTDEAPAVIDVVVPESRRVLPQPGVRIHRRSALDRTDAQPMIHPAARPPRVRLEQALLDACDATSAAGAIDLVLRATQRRLTTADLLRVTIAQRVEFAGGAASSPFCSRWKRGSHRRWNWNIGAPSSAVIGCRPGCATSARMDPTADPGTGTSDMCPGGW